MCLKMIKTGLPKQGGSHPYPKGLWLGSGSEAGPWFQQLRQTDSVTRKADVDQQLVADVLLQQKSSPQCKAAP